MLNMFRRTNKISPVPTERLEEASNEQTLQRVAALLAQLQRTHSRQAIDAFKELKKDDIIAAFHEPEYEPLVGALVMVGELNGDITGDQGRIFFANKVLQANLKDPQEPGGTAREPTRDETFTAQFRHEALSAVLRKLVKEQEMHPDAARPGKPSFHA